MSPRSSQLPPYASTSDTRVSMAVRSMSVPPESFWDVQSQSSRVEHHSEAIEEGSRRGLNWYAVLGLALAVAVGAGFWTGVGLIAARLWR